MVSNMIYLKRILKVILGFILTLIIIISLPITVLLYPFYLMIYYVVYGINVENGKKYLPNSISVYIIIGSPSGDPILLFSGGEPE